MNIVKPETAEEYSRIIELLIKLQEVNALLTELEQEINILRKETELDEKKFNSKRLQYDKNYPALLSVQEEVKALEDEIIEIHQNVEKCEDRKKKIKTIKEFKAVNREIDNLTKENAMKENQLITKKRDVEFKTDKVQKIKESLEEIQVGFEQKKKELADMTAERTKDIEKEQKKRKKIEGDIVAIDSIALNLFNRIYNNKRGLAVTVVHYHGASESIVCQGCYSQLPKQVEIDIKRHQQITFCPSCSRILYLQTEDEEVLETEEVL